jgi:hypothetical protein
MKVGEKARLIISSEYAYGPNGIGPIPGNATLVSKEKTDSSLCRNLFLVLQIFEVEVIAFK